MLGLNRRLLREVTAACLLAAAAAFLLSADETLSGLGRLYKDHRYFELRDAVAAAKDAPADELEFYRGAVDNVFNRLDSSIAHLLRYLESEPAAGGALPLAREAWTLLADSYRRAGFYRKSAEAQRLILERYGAELEADEKTNRESQSVLWGALADVPPQTVEVLNDSDLVMENRHIPVAIGDRTYYFSYDTGASLSILYRSAAEEMGLAAAGRGAKIQSATGAWIDARVAAVPEMRLGWAVVRDAVLLILPDDAFPRRQVRQGVERRGLLGAPVLAALKEISETRDGRLLIPASPPPRPVQNMCFFGTKPIIDVAYRGDRLLLFADTGSSLTFLYPPFFRRYKDEIRAGSEPRDVRMGGAGGERTVTVHHLGEFAFRTGGRDLVLAKVMVHTQVTHSVTDIFDGTLGRDVLSLCERMTFNFESMSFVLE